ncbi:MAG: peptidylprolyl isomerase [Proteobacteria bacterium]|nr:peptidylprolyl isomerase [Pseudomonadota bacterium]
MGTRIHRAGMALALLAAILADGCRRPEVASELDVAPGEAAPTPRELLDRAEDRRAFSDDLAALADSGDREIRARLALALGRIGDPRAVPSLLRLLRDDDALVREEAVFSIGLLADRAGTAAIEAVVAALGAGDDLVPVSVALDALGRVAAKTELHHLAAHLDAADPGERAAAARALGLAGQRGLPFDAAATAKLAAALGDEAEPVRFMAAFALFRGGLAASEDASAAPLRRAAAQDPSAEVRAMALRALAKGAALDDADHDRAMADVDDRVAATAMLVIGNIPEDLRCGVAARALASIAARLERSPPDLDGTFAHVARTALEQSIGCEGGDVSRAAQRIAAALPKAAPSSAPSAGEARVRCLARLVGGGDALSLVACDPARPHAGKRMLVLKLGALGSPSSKDVRTLAALSAEPDLRVAAPALEALAKIRRSDARAAVVAALDDDHAPKVSAALDGIAAAADNFKAGAAPVAGIGAVVDRFDPVEEGHGPLLSAVGALGALGDAGAIALLARLAANLRPEVRVAALDALSKIPGGAAPALLPPLEPARPASHAPAPELAGKELLATVSTTRGDFVVRLRQELAPATVESFVDLAGRDLFDGTEIHRVVPNLVVQAGDPTGSGLGDAGYALRCELSAAPYERGTVGMALSGKDTGGSQFFVALSRQPHLDGHYTAFGEVTRGMEVLDVIEEGDLILDVDVSAGDIPPPGAPAQSP